MQINMKKMLARILVLALILSALSMNFTTETRAASKSGFVIVLDPGHDSTHCRGKNKASGICEETYTLAIAKSLKSKLEAYGFTVKLTRSDDSCPVGSGSSTSECLSARTAVARNAGADLYVSLHLNASGSDDGNYRSANGSVIYITNYSHFKSSMSALAAQISSKLKYYCGLAQKTPNGSTWLSSSGRTYGDGNTQDYLAVMRNCCNYEIPSILIEHGFMDNQTDAYLLNYYGASACATADAEAINAWYEAGCGKSVSTASSGSSSSSGSLGTGYVNYSYLNLRSGAGTNYSIVAVLSKGDALTLHSLSNGWYKVTASHGGKSYSGYVSSQYVLKASSASVTGSSGSLGTGYVNYSYLNLRSGAGTGYSIVVKLSEFDGLKLKSLSNGWYQVSAFHQGQTYSGYVSSSYVSKGTTGYVNYSYLNVRSGPGTGYSQVGKLNHYDSVLILSSSGNWYKINYLSGGSVCTGYVSASYITKN